MSGYLQSKWVAEQLIYKAGEAAMLQTSIVRVGQLTGGLSGAWDASQWFPAMVKSALYLESLPDGDDVSCTPTHNEIKHLLTFRHIDCFMDSRERGSLCYRRHDRAFSKDCACRASDPCILEFDNANGCRSDGCPIGAL